MTRCGRSASINLKSSVYNPNGQGYFNQLATYNSMACHLRRILTAKSVVETRNERYTRSKRQRELKDEKIKRSLQQSPSCEIIDTLAYDTEHHPADILKSSSSSKAQCYRRSRRSPYCEESSVCYKDCQKSMSKSRSPCKHEDCWYNKKYTRNLSEKRKTNNKTEEKCQVFKRNQSPEYASSFASDNSSPRQSGDESNESKQCNSNKLTLHSEKEEARYSQFVYDITQDIVRKRLHTDKEFKEVFRKHLEKNANILDKHRMLYEIYQLKISLSIDDEDDEEYEHLSNYIYSKKFPTILKPEPPTPPKVLDDNKVIDKLKHYEKLIGNTPGTCIPSKKNVVLVDANPEIHITERDILQTLIETNVDPNQAEHICRTLFHKSKDTELCQMVTRSILEQRLKLQKVKSKEETKAKSEERQQQISYAENSIKKMERIQLNDIVNMAEMRNETTSSNWPLSSLSKYKSDCTDSSNDLLETKIKDTHLTYSDNQKVKKSKEMNTEEENDSLEKINKYPSIIKEVEENEEDLNNEHYIDDYEDEILSENEESQTVDSTEYRDESKRDRNNDRNKTIQIEDDRSIQYSEFADEQKDSISASKDEISYSTQSINENQINLDKSEDVEKNMQVFSNKYLKKQNCRIDCEKRSLHFCNSYCFCDSRYNFNSNI